jgi:murein L,D-transpeptidase YafK
MPLMKPLLRAASVITLVAFLAGCQAEKKGGYHLAPIPARTVALMESKGTAPKEPMIVRIFKEEAELEVWKRRSSDQQFVLLKTYPICAWSGKLGPKVKEGDRQAPEGFYTVTPGHMNPNSSYHLSFNTGFPNTFDRAHGRTGSHLMVHGSCSSRGCYAIEDEQIREIYAMGREAFRGGQRSFQLQAYPFRMTPKNMARHRDNENMPFWRNLKEGYDAFALTRTQPVASVCGKRYVFNATGANGMPLDPVAACPQLQVDPAFAAALTARQARDEEQTRNLSASIPAVTDIAEQDRRVATTRHPNRPGSRPVSREDAETQIAYTPAPRTPSAPQPSATTGTALAAAPATRIATPPAARSLPPVVAAAETTPRQGGSAFGWLRGTKPDENASVAVTQPAPDASPKPSAVTTAPVPMPLPTPTSQTATPVAAPSPATAEAAPEQVAPRRSPIDTVFSVFR